MDEVVRDEDAPGGTHRSPGRLRRRTPLLLPARGALFAAVLLAAGCTSAPSPDEAAADALTREQIEINDALDGGGAIERLPPCGAVPEAARGRRPTGLELPPGSVVQLVEPGDPLVTVHGYVELTPVLVRRYYQERAGLRVYNTEDEVSESEVLVGNGRRRTYVKALATCATGSTLYAVVGPGGAAGLPAPSGSPPPS